MQIFSEDATMFSKKILNFFCPQKVEKIGCHSRFNPECNTERGCIDSLYIALGLQRYLKTIEIILLIRDMVVKS